MSAVVTLGAFSYGGSALDEREEIAAVAELNGDALAATSVFSPELKRGLTDGSHTERTISVTGTASASVEPDTLVIRIGVETQAATASSTLRSNAALMESVIKAITDVGVPKDDISTAAITLSPVYESHDEDGKWMRELVGYSTHNTVTVETAMLDKAAEIIDDAIEAGANRIDNVGFALSADRRAKMHSELVNEAMLDAVARASVALEPLNHTIDGVKSVRLSDFDFPVLGHRTSVADEAFQSTPVLPSNQMVAVYVDVVFLIASIDET